MAGDSSTTTTRTLNVVVRERAEVADESGLSLGRMPLLGLVLCAISVLAWSWIGPVAALGLGAGLGMIRLGVAPRPKRYETVTRKAAVEISSAGVKVVGSPLVPRTSIAHAYFQPRGAAPPTLRCLEERGLVVFEAEVADEAEARELLAALGHDVKQSRAVFKMASPPVGRAIGAVAALGFLFSTMAGIVLLMGRSVYALAVVPVLVACFAALNLSQYVAVGIDGLAIRWLGKERFIPYEQIESVRGEQKAAVVALRDGTRLRLAAPAPRIGTRDSELVAQALVARIEEARREHETSTGPRELAALVGRGARAIAEWRASLTQMHDPDRGGGYRDRAARGEDLWRVVEDATAPEDARAGAAVALRDEEGAKPRLRVAAEAVASPKLRIALERAADAEADDASLDEALEAFDRREA